jgi:hypothetical protein
VPCGHAIPGATSDVNGRFVDDPDVLVVLAAEIHDKTAHVPRVSREWRTRPTRRLSAELRRTREGDWEVLVERLRARREREAAA